MEMRPVGLIVMGIICLAAALLIPRCRTTYCCHGRQSSHFAGCGQVFLPRSKRSIRVWFNPIVMNSMASSSPLNRGTHLDVSVGGSWMYRLFQTMA